MRLRVPARAAIAIVTLATFGLTGLITTSSANAAGPIVYPSMMLITKGAQCTANFVYHTSTATYIGQAAHCSSTGNNTQTNGCTTRSYPLGTVVTNSSGRRIGVLAYNSWIAMQKAGTKDPNLCDANDLALVKVDSALISRTSPTMPGIGGPVGLAGAFPSPGSQVYAVGNSSLLLGLGNAVAQTGIIETTADNGWQAYVLMVRPGVPGDSGSGYLDARGRALGQLSTISVGTAGVGNTIGNLAKEIAYAQTHGMSGLTVNRGGAFKGVSGLIAG